MKKFLKLLLILVTFSTVSVYAATDKGLFRADDSLNVNETLDGTSFLAGTTVSSSGKVDGILFAAGNSVNISSESDYAFLAGSSLNVTNASFKDGFIAGSTVDITDSIIERDLYLAGAQVSLKSNVGRNAYVTGGDIVIDSTINGDLEVDGNNITINSNTVINGVLKYNEDANITISKDATIVNTETYENKKVDVEISPVSLFISKIMDKLFSFVNLMVVGLLMILLIPKLFKKLKEVEKEKLLPDFAWGLLLLIAVPFVSIILMITVVGLSTAFIALGLYILLIYISTIISTYKITSLLLGNKIKNDYALLFIGLVAVYIIKLIPFIGGLLSFVLLCLGMGLLVSLYKRK